MTTETTEFHWRKTKAGDWVICGSRNHLAHAAETHSQIVVTKRSGEQKAVRIESVGREFGEGLAYGYLSRSRWQHIPGSPNRLRKVKAQIKRTRANAQVLSTFVDSQSL